MKYTGNLSRRVLLGLMLFCSYSISADTGTSTDKDKDKEPTIILIKHNPTQKRGPRMPSNQFLWFTYDGVSQQCELTMSASAESMSVTIEQLPVGFYYLCDVTPDYPSFSVDIPSGYYRITCTTDEGATFIGEGDKYV